MKIQDYIPVVISILIIISVAFLERHSKLVAAVTATMPIKVPLALWVVYAVNQGEQKTIQTFSRSLLVGIIPTLGFIIAAWLGARAGWKLAPVLLVGYGVWGVGVGISFLFRTALGV
ncbi:MAG: hypothetical protein R6U57_05475 [Anaerolineales bacterium]